MAIKAGISVILGSSFDRGTFGVERRLELAVLEDEDGLVAPLALIARVDFQLVELGARLRAAQGELAVIDHGAVCRGGVGDAIGGEVNHFAVHVGIIHGSGDRITRFFAACHQKEGGGGHCH